VLNPKPTVGQHADAFGVVVQASFVQQHCSEGRQNV
jgi:hypothetical protein